MILELSGKYKYDFTIKRNITIISGNSATGKTTLVDGIIQASGKVRGYSLVCDVPCRAISVTSDDDLDSFLARVNRRKDEDCILFFDEDCCDFYNTKDFARLVGNSRCYFVLIGRDALKELPYSVKEIYSLVEIGKYPQIKGIFNTLESRNKSLVFRVKPDILVIEGQGSDCDFFNKVYNEDMVLAARGNSNIPNVIDNLHDCGNKNVVVYVDGSAYGSLIDSTIAKLSILNCKDWYIIAHESFEYDMLMSKTFIRRFKSKIAGFDENIESSEFVSWERYFSYLLSELTKGTKMQYTKSYLPEYSLGETVLNDIFDSIGVLER